MNNSKIFVFVIAVLLIVAVLIELSVPKRFIWEPTFNPNSKEPFGSILFDSLAKSSMKNGYTVKHTTFYQLLNDSSVKSPRSIIDIHSSYKYEGLELKSMLDFVSKGNKVLICSDKFTSEFADTLQFLYESAYFSISSLKRAASRGLFRSSSYIIWEQDNLYPKQVYKAYSDFCESYFRLDKDTIYEYEPDDVVEDTVYERKEVAESEPAEEEREPAVRDVRLKKFTVNETSHEWTPYAYTDRKYDGGEYNKKYPLVLRRKWGRGEIVLCSTPLLLTNYGIMDGENVSYVYRVLNMVSDYPAMRMVDIPPAEEHISQSPMRYFVATPPLRWALYLSLLTLLLFMIFTARRRQRAIPVVKKPENHQLEFTKLIGTLYYQDGAHGDLVRKKYTYFTEYLRREVQIDVDDEVEDDENFSMLAKHTGMDEKDVKHRIKATRSACRSGLGMTVEEMTMYIDYMNEIIRGIGGR